MTKQNSLTLGSLFDGIGGFPYAASFYNIKPLWASEILPTAVSVTSRHFPGMEHVGDITELDGGKLPPVDIITFGSPCQGLSMAGRRLGLADERSGLFGEAIRIIREMQEATNGNYPKIALWENVPGALSTAGGRDFRAVIEAFTAAKVPMPESGKWANAGMVRGRGVDIAWCVYNAQYFGVAQRRRRIFLIADFTGRRAGEILFIPKSLRRYFEAGGTPREAAAAYAESRAGAADEQPGVGFDGYNDALTGEQAATLGINCGVFTGRNGVLQKDETVPVHATTAGGNEIASTLYAAYGTRWNGNAGAYSGDHFVAEPLQKSNCLNGWDTQQSRVYTEDGQAPTLAGADGGGGRNPAGLVYAAFMGGQSATAGSIAYSETVSPTLRGSSGANMTPCVCEPELARTLTARGDSSPCADRGQNIVAVAQPPGINGNVAGTLDASYYKGAGARSGIEREVVLCRASGQSNAEQLENLSATLNCGAEQPIIVHPETGDAEQVLCVASGQIGAEILENRGVTLMAGHNQPYIAHPKAGGESELPDAAYGFDLQQITSKENRSSLRQVQPSLCKTSNPHVVSVHPPVSGTLCGSGAGLSRTAGMANETDLCVVAAVDCRNLKENGDLSGTLQSKTTPGYSLNYQNPVRLGYIVRRLTPTECERLQGYPDGWTEYGHDEKPISDTKRYQMLGNSIAVPCAAYIMEGITQALLSERR